MQQDMRPIVTFPESCRPSPGRSFAANEAIVDRHGTRTSPASSSSAISWSARVRVISGCS